MALSRITEAVASFTDLTIGDDLTLTDDLLMASDANIIKFGADADVTLTHVHNTGLLLNSTSVIQFNDASQNIGAPSATVLDINATDEIELNATLVDVNANLDVSGTIVSGGTLTATTTIGIGSAVLTEAELEFLDGITAGTGAASKALVLDASADVASGLRNLTASGDIQAANIVSTSTIVPNGANGASLGSASAEFSDLFLFDGAVINLGADQDVTLTHVADTGILLNSSRKIQFSDAAESIHSDGSKLILTSNSVAFSLPTSDGSSGQALVTNGSGVISFASVATNTPSSADGQALGSASLEWSDLFLADGGTVTFGNDQDIILTHVADTGLTLSHGGNDDNKPIVFQLKSEEDDVQANELIASIEFAAGDSDGTDGATVAAGIHAIAEGTFSASANATKLVFTTGVSETAAASATAKMTLSSAGLLTIADDLVIKDGGTIGVASDADAITIASNGAVTLTQALSGTSADFDGGVTIDNITIDGTEIDLSSGDLTLDVAGDIIRDADGADVKISDGGTHVGTLSNSSSDFVITSAVQDKDILFNGNDGGSAITALTLDMSDGGTASFRNHITLNDGSIAKFGGASDLQIYHDGSNSYIDETGTGDLYIRANPNIYIQKYTGENMIVCSVDGSVDLFHDDTKKFETTSTGVYVTGAVNIGGTGTANALDDYEEGTFTPTLANTGGVAVAGYDIQVGFYTKIGRMVHANIVISPNGLGSTGTSNVVLLGGLPFDSLSSTNHDTAISVSHAVNLNITAGQNIGGFLPANSTNIRLSLYDSSDGTTDFTFGELSADGQIKVSIQYNTA